MHRAELYSYGDVRVQLPAFHPLHSAETLFPISRSELLQTQTHDTVLRDLCSYLTLGFSLHLLECILAFTDSSLPLLARPGLSDGSNTRIHPQKLHLLFLNGRRMYIIFQRLSGENTIGEAVGHPGRANTSISCRPPAAAIHSPPLG